MTIKEFFNQYRKPILYWLVFGAAILIAAGAIWWSWSENLKVNNIETVEIIKTNLCGPEPPAVCAAGMRLTCEDGKWECREEKENQDISNWKTYRNEEYGFDFKYPIELGDIAIDKVVVVNEVISFNSSNALIDKVFYHKSSKTVAFVGKDKKYEYKKEDCALNGPFYQKSLYKAVYPSEMIKTIYSVPNPVISCFSFLNIEDVNWSPNGKYIFFTLLGYEYFTSKMMNIDDRNDVLKNYNILIGDIYKDIYWSEDGNVLAIKSSHEFMGGTGILALFVSDYGNVEKLNNIFSLSIEEDLAQSKIYDISIIKNEKALFSVFSRKYDFESYEYYDEKTTKYEYDIKSKELHEL